MMIYTVTKNNKNCNAEVTLPTSKSITNRVLIIKALCSTSFDIKNISESEDTKVMLKGFDNLTSGATIDVGPAGTSMRFMTALLANTVGNFVITGSERMKQRPIAKLVDALRQLGADIEYAEKEGYPPLKINGKKMDGHQVEIDGNISSQYISALLMIGPMLPNGLHLILRKKIISASYIKLTLGLMKHFGVDAQWHGNEITIAPQSYKACDITIEGDWSAASYWYQIALLSDKATIKINGLFEDSLQGDAKIVDLFSVLGVKTSFVNDGIIITKENQNFTGEFQFDFLENPDMVQTFAATLPFLNIPFKFTGTESLSIKETDRINAMIAEMKKVGFVLKSDSPENLYWDGETCIKATSPLIHTYEDHRMAMAFAPLAMVMNDIRIENPMVVGKSYPSFWQHLGNAEFVVESKA